MGIINDIDLSDKAFSPSPIIEDVTLSQVPFPREYKEFVSRMVAEKLLRVFEVSTIGILLGGAVMILLILHLSYSPQDSETLVEKTIVPFLRGAAVFATTVFGPLLAFILGFYFAKAETRLK